MFSRKFVSAILIFFIFFSTSAQNPVLDEIDIPSLKKHLDVIASDSLMGRQIGADNNGLDMAADYIIKSINKIGLSPVNGSFSQPLSIYQTQADEQNSYLQIFNKNGISTLKTDSVVCLSATVRLTLKKQK